MAEQHLDEFYGNNFLTTTWQNIRDTLSGIWYRVEGAWPATVNIIRQEHSICRAVAAVGGGRIYHDSTDEDNEFSITGLTVVYRGSLVTIAGAINQSLSGGDVAHYVYADPTSGTWVVNTTGWPSTPHVPIAIITLSAGVWDWGTFEDKRSWVALQCVNAHSDAGKHAQVQTSGSTTLTAAQSGTTFHNTGAVAEHILTLPAAANGLHYRFIVAAAQHVRVKAPSGAVVRNGATASSDGGYIRSNAVGSTLELECVGSVWYVRGGANGTWTIDA